MTLHFLALFSSPGENLQPNPKFKVGWSRLSQVQAISRRPLTNQPWSIMQCYFSLPSCWSLRSCRFKSSLLGFPPLMTSSFHFLFLIMWGCKSPLDKRQRIDEATEQRKSLGLRIPEQDLSAPDTTNSLSSHSIEVQRPSEVNSVAYQLNLVQVNH